MDQLRRNLPAVWAALLAVLLQLSFAVPVSAAPAGLRAHICGQPGGTQPAHDDNACVACPVCNGMAAQAGLLPGPPAHGAARCFILLRQPAAGHAAPPFVGEIAAAEPRGPPSLS